ncbi:MAG: adenylate/guanylate cyclase domain-containing protein [Verrucomicrobiota bacterium]|nr:adenylate/guanylate cyclase domain-containing protein [Verrucomicrobiota bacterium]
MKYKTKLLILIILLAVVSNATIAGVLYFKAKDYLFTHIQSKVLSIAVSAALAIDVPTHERIVNDADESGPDYAAITKQLRSLRDANRRTDLKVKFLYTMRPIPGESNVYRYIVDCEENIDERAKLNEIYRPVNPRDIYPIDKPYVQSEMTKDQWGTFLTATAPMLNAAGKPVGLIGVDISADEVERQLSTIQAISLYTLGGSIFIAVIMAIWLANAASKPLLQIQKGVENIARGDFVTEIKINTKDEFGQVASAINAMAIGLQQRDNLKGTLARYVSQEVTDTVMASSGKAELKSERKKITVLFSDVRGFTSLSESITPEEMVELLNVYFERMIDSILKNGGYLNKFMGDGLMAVFGAHRDDPYQEEHAIHAAMDMRKALAELREKWRAEGRIERVQDLHIGIGINTGVAIVGNIGSHQKMEFGCIGDSVNLASRLESATKEMPGVDLLLSEYTFIALRARFKFKPCGDIKVKGKADPIKVYTIE